MGESAEIQLVVKKTFLQLEFVEPACAVERRDRSFTDSEVHKLRKDAASQDANDGQPPHRHSAPAASVSQALGDDEVVDASQEPSREELAEENARLARENAELRAERVTPSGLVAPMAASTGQPGAQLESQQQAATAAALAMMAAASPMVMPAAWFRPMGTVPPQAPIHEAAQAPTRASPHRSQRATLSLSSKVSSSIDPRTTLMLRNLPNQYTRGTLVDMLNSEGFAGMFSFVYLPIDFKTHLGLGYAFVDLVSPIETQKCRHHFEGFIRWVVKCEKICSVSWSHPDQQGLDTHIHRYRNSPIMHESVPDEWRPALFSHGVRVPFPPATKRIRAPRIRVV